MSIKDPEYYLPIIWPEMYHETLGSGANKPILITGLEEQSGFSGNYVVKLMASERMDKTACFKELLATFIAMELGIPVVKPVVVNIEKDFADAMYGKECYQRLQQSIGLNYGSQYVKQHMIISKEAPLIEKQLKNALDIFCFDMLIQNPDRTMDKQNMFSVGEKIVIFDHELAFSFIQLIGGDPEPWNVTKEKVGNWKDLFLPPKLRKRELNHEEISEKLGRLDETFWDKVENLMPGEWMTSLYFEKIRKHVDKVQVNKDAFIVNIQKLLL